MVLLLRLCILFTLDCVRNVALVRLEATVWLLTAFNVVVEVALEDDRTVAVGVLRVHQVQVVADLQPR